MTQDKKKLIAIAKQSAQTFQDSMVALGWLLTDKERLELRRLVPLREYERGVDTIDSIRGRVHLPVLMAECMEDAFSGKAAQEESPCNCGCGCY